MLSPRTPLIVLALATWAIGYCQSPSELVARALQNRESVKAAMLTLRAAEQGRSAAGALLPTRLEFGNASRPDVGGGEDLTLFQPLDFFGKSRAAGAVANGTVMLAKASLRQVYIDVQGEVLVAYATWSNAEQLRQSAIEQLALAEQLHTATAKKVQVRSLPEIQLVRADLDLERQTQILVDRTASVEAALLKLTQAVGLATPDDFSTAPFDLDIPVETAAMVGDQRPDLLAALADRAGARSEGTQARLSRLPDIEIQARRAPWSLDQQYGLRIQFVLPLWDHGAASNREGAAKKREQSAEARYQDRLKVAKTEIASTQILLAAAEKSVVAYTKLVAGARILLQKTQRGFEIGASTLIDVIDARRAVADALDLLANAKLNRNLAVEATLRAHGQLLGESK